VDPRIKIAENRMTKINHSYAYGGIDLLQKTVSNLLNVPIDYYITIKLDGVIKIIDQLGGIKIDVEKDLYYTDKAGGLYIDLKRGPQILSGKQAVAYLRFRHDNKGDIGRIRRQQVFIDALLKKIVANNDFFTTPTLLLKLSSNIKTNLSAREIVGLAVQINNIFQGGDIETGSIPGAITTYDGLSYWRPDIIGLDKVVSETLLGFEKEVTEDIKVITQDTEASQEKRRALSANEAQRIQDTSETDATYEQAKKLLSIEVLNGNGEQGIAMKATSFIRDNGFNVLRYGNAGSFNYNETRIVDWKGNVEHVIALANLLRIDPSKIIIYHKPEKKLDVTIVIGQDWAEITAQKI
jgi:LCP family protein required for cell wall assembly